MQRPLKIGTRGSPLALYQARLVQRLLAEQAGATLLAAAVFSRPDLADKGLAVLAVKTICRTSSPRCLA